MGTKRFVWGGWAVLAAVLAAVPATLAADPNAACLECHADKELTRTNDQGRVLSLWVDAARLAASSHRTNTCASCHSDLAREHPDNDVAARPVDCARCHARESESYQASVHGAAVRTGKAGAATCVDCHGSHDVRSPASPQSPLHFSRLASTCGECHAEAARDLLASVHGKAVAGGVREAATCTDCHSEHRIEALKGASGHKVAGEVCSKCHASERINTKFRLPRDRVKTFFESYHGLAAQGRSASAANCASCHGYHRILPSSDPESSIHAGHLVQTCGKCHPGAGANFALGRVHVDDSSDAQIGAVVNRWVRRVYLGLIVSVVGLLGLHNLMAWLRQALEARGSRGRTVVRMGASQRAQHLALLISFVVLALSGFALKFPESWLAGLMGSEDARRWIHRIAGLALLGVGAWHLVYAGATREGRRLVRDLWFRKADARDLAANARYLAGRSPRRARFGRFGYPEKIEYWAVVWGTLIMGATGLAIWFKIDVTRFVPRWVVDVATTVHYYEAILACLAIAVWHFYHVFLHAGSYPMNWAWWDGKVSTQWQEEEHPLETVEAPAQAAPHEPEGHEARRETVVKEPEPEPAHPPKA